MTPAALEEVDARSRLPVRLIVPAPKLPAPSRRTIALATFADAAFETTVAFWVPVTSPRSDAVKFVASPLRFAVIVPAAKLPLPSRRTSEFGTFADVGPEP